MRGCWSGASASPRDSNATPTDSVLDELQKRGDAVMDDALAWIDEVRAQRFFAWVHLFDPHLPYDPPEPFRSRFADRSLPGRGRLHGRARGADRLPPARERASRAHARGRDRRPRGEPGRARGGEPRLLRLRRDGGRPLDRPHALGPARQEANPGVARGRLPHRPRSRGPGSREPGIDGQSPRSRPPRPRAGLSGTSPTRRASTRGFHYGWHELRALRDGACKLVDAPRVELYDLARDPGEKENLARAEGPHRRGDEGRPPAKACRQTIPPRRRHGPPSTRRRSSAWPPSATWGAPSPRTPKTALADPKDKIAVFGRITAAKEADEAGRRDEAIARMRAVVEEEPDILDAHLTLGGWLLKSGRPEEAIVPSEDAPSSLKPDDEMAVMQLVAAGRARGRHEEVARRPRALRQSTGEESRQTRTPGTSSPSLRLEMGRTAEAESALRRSLEADLAIRRRPRRARRARPGASASSPPAEAELRRGPRRRPGGPHRPLQPRAREERAEGKASEAEALYRAELADNPAARARALQPRAPAEGAGRPRGIPRRAAARSGGGAAARGPATSCSPTKR